MDKRQINEMVAEYKRTGDEALATEVYRALQKRITLMVERHSYDWKIDKDEFFSVVNLRFYRSINKYDQKDGDFENLLFSAISRGFLNLKRDLRSQIENETPAYIVNDDGAEEETLEGLYFEGISIDGEEVVMDELNRYSASLVVKSLLSKSSEEVRSFAKDFLKGMTKADIARKHGVSAMKVTRSFKRLASEYDESEFGDINDYIQGGLAK